MNGTSPHCQQCDNKVAEIVRIAARVKQLEALVKDAFHEGFNAAPDDKYWGSNDADKAWEHSDAREALETQ